MRLTLLYATILILFTNCTSKKDSENSILDLIPHNASLVIKVNDFETLKEEFSNNDLLKKIENLQPLSKINSKLKPLNYLTNQKKGVLAFIAADSINLDFTYITNDSLKFTNWDDLANKSIETLNYNTITITKYEIENSLFFSTYFKSHTILSSSQTILKNVIDSNDKELNPSLLNFYAVSNTDKTLNIWLDIDKGTYLLNQLFTSDQKISDFAGWLSLDLTLNDSEIILNGVAKPGAEKQQFISLFENTKPIPNTTATLSPSDANYYKSYGLNDFKTFSANKKINNFKTSSLDSLLNTVEEIGLAEIEDEKILLLKTYGTATLLDYLNEDKVNTDEFGGNEIWELNSKNEIFETIEPLIGVSKYNFLSLIENTLVFSKTKNTLEQLLTKYKTGDTFDKTNLFRNAENKLTSSSSMQTVSNSKGTAAIIKESISNTLGLDFDKLNLSDYVFGFQLIADDGFYHTNFLVTKNVKEADNNSVTTAFEVQFNTDLATVPQFITNHNNRKKEIIVQDQANILYLISNSGKILWEKQLEGTIQGKVVQVDLFKNGKLQLAFTTNNEFLILDRNGKEVKPFTKQFSGGNLNPLSVFDYEGNKNYRFVVTQNEKVFMYNSKGEIVKGFKYDTAEADIVDAPKHFRIGKKDYLVFKLKNGQLKILNRVGNTRVNLKNKFSFSENEIKLYQNKFTFTTTDGILIQIDQSGNVTSSKLNLANDHGMDATSRTLAIMNDNVLRIRDKKVPLELGVYSKPTIFYLNDKIYISVTDIQNQKIYLFDSQAESIPNFPIFGNSIIDMADIDNNKNAEFVAKDQENSIKVFKIR